MPKKKPGMTPEEQSEKFKKVAGELEAAGELSPTDALRRMDAALSKHAKKAS